MCVLVSADIGRLLLHQDLERLAGSNRMCSSFDLPAFCTIVYRHAYNEAGVPERLCLLAEEGIGHQRTPAMDAAIKEWFDDHLLVTRMPEPGV